MIERDSKNELAIEVLKKLRMINGSVRQHFREVEQTCGITESQLWILQEINKSPGIGVSELANRLAIHQSTCSQLVEKLVALDLMQKVRSKEDQRRVGLQVTEAASKLLVKAPKPSGGILPKALQSLPVTALLELDNSLIEIIELLQKVI